MILLWATRGHDWGFRFLIATDGIDPLPLYEEVFSGAGEDSEIFLRQKGKVALRFPDPKNREDAAGRTIIHDFVLAEASAPQIRSVEEGRRLIWPQVAEEYGRRWGDPAGR